MLVRLVKSEGQGHRSRP